MLNVPMGTPDAVAQDIRKMPYSPFDSSEEGTERIFININYLLVL